MENSKYKIQNYNNQKLYNDIIKQLEQQLSDETYQRIKNSKMHLGIFSQPFLTLMLDGKKTIESRFSKNKIAPFDKISKYDIVIVKESSKKIVALFTVKEVLQFTMKDTSVHSLKEKYNNEILADNQFWNNKEKTSNYATLIKIGELIKLKPFPINKVGMQSWIVLN